MNKEKKQKQSAGYKQWYTTSFAHHYHVKNAIGDTDAIPKITLINAVDNFYQI